MQKKNFSWLDDFKQVLDTRKILSPVQFLPLRMHQILSKYWFFVVVVDVIVVVVVVLVDVVVVVLVEVVVVDLISHIPANGWFLLWQTFLFSLNKNWSRRIPKFFCQNTSVFICLFILLSKNLLWSKLLCNRFLEHYKILKLNAQ